MRTMLLLAAAFCLTGMAGAGESLSGTEDDGAAAGAELKWAPGTVLLLRHAPAPGFGDPPHFRLDDCATQRNLDAAGREMARRIGLALQRSAPPIAAVYSSEWCRCRDTAAALGLGTATAFAGLNSFFQFAPKAATMAKLRAFLAELDRTGPPVLLVTHYVVIGELTGIFPPSGGLVAYDLATERGWAVTLSLPALAGEK